MLAPMSLPVSTSIRSDSPEATAQLAAALANTLSGNETICLTGDLGAGKSHFARTIVATLSGETEIPSPTFTIVQTYEASGFEIWHADLYRLSSANEAYELGLDDAFGSALCIIEWPDRLEALPGDALWVDLKVIGEFERAITLKSQSGRWEKAMTTLRRELA